MFREIRRHRDDIVTVLVLFVGAFLIYFYILTRFPLIYGIDGPYYLTQVSNILRSGTMVYGDPPLAFYFFAGLAALFNDITLGVKIGSSLLCAAVVAPSYLLSKRMTKSTVSGVFSAIAAVGSYGLLRMAADLMKNAVGSLFLFFSIYFMYRMVEEGFTKLNVVGTIVGVVLTASTHVLDFGVVLLYLVLISVYSIVFGVKRRQMLKFTLLVGGLTAAFSIAAIFVYTKHFTDFGKGLSFLEEFLSALTEEELPELKPFTFQGLGISYALVLVGALLCYLDYVGDHKEVSIMMASAATTLALLVFPLIPQKWLWRFNLMTFVPVSMIIGRLVVSAGDKLSRIAIGLVATLFVVQQAFPLMMTLRPTITGAEYDDLEHMSSLVPEGSPVVARMPLGYWAEYLLDGKLIRPNKLSSYEEEDWGFLVERSEALPPRRPGWTLLYEGSRLSLFKIPLRQLARPIA